MKIIHCPKGGKMPLGYCKESCLNYHIECKANRGASSKRKARSPVTEFQIRERPDSKGVLSHLGTLLLHPLN